MVNIANHVITVAFICYKKFSCYLVYTHKIVRQCIPAMYMYIGVIYGLMNFVFLSSVVCMYIGVNLK